MPCMSMCAYQSKPWQGGHDLRFVDVLYIVLVLSMSSCNATREACTRTKYFTLIFMLG